MIRSALRTLRFAAVALVCVVVSNASLAQQSGNFQTLLSAGLEARAAGDFHKAAEAFSKALALRPENIEALYLLGTSLAFAGRYEAARQRLSQALQIDPENIDVRLARTRAAAWGGDYRAAADDMSEALRRAPDNAESHVLDGWLHYVQGRHAAAIEAYRRALALAPGSTEAAEGMASARRALRAAKAAHQVEKTDASSAPMPWRLDVNYSHSTFTRVPRKNWREPSLSLAYDASDRLTVKGRIDHSRRFGLTDVRFEGGFAYKIPGGHVVQMDAGVTPNEDFLAKRRLLAGALYTTRLIAAGATQLTLDGKREVFADGVSDGLNPGLVQYFGSLSATGRWINSWDSSNRRTFGWLLRGDWQVNDGMALYLGLADAPETVEQATVGQRSVFAGLIAQLTPSLALRFDFAREDRQESYIRRVLGVGATVRF